MSTERIIQVADLSLILGSLRSLQSDIGTVSGQVDMVGSNLAQTRAELSRLEQAFNDFVQADLKAKELGFAETRQVKIRQEIENKFGQYAIVRRQATGILQAADIQLVRQETIRNATEELMLSTPRYWLAPALVALAAWLTDKRQLAERALAEATRRDDEKTSLFFSLIGRRAGRAEVSRIWLDRYFGLQNPYSLDRQTVVMVDALANGVFNTDTALLCTKRISGWIEELSQQAGFAQTQRGQWGDALRSKTPHFNHAQRYTHLSRFSPMWNDLNGALNAASMQSIVLEHFQVIFQGEIKVASSVLIAVDNLFNTLSTSILLRTRAFAVLQSVGLGPKGFRRMLVAECASYALRGLGFGLVFSVGVVWLFWTALSSSVDLSFELPWGYVAGAVAGVVAVLGLSVAYALRRSHALNIVEALRADAI